MSRPELFGTTVRDGVLYRAYLTPGKTVIYVPVYFWEKRP